MYLIYLYIAIGKHVREHGKLILRKSVKPGIYILDTIFWEACMKFLHV